MELQAAGACVNAALADSGVTSLRLACYLGAAEVARSLIAGGAHKYARDKCGRTCRGTLPEGSSLSELFAQDGTGNVTA